MKKFSAKLSSGLLNFWRVKKLRYCCRRRSCKKSGKYGCLCKNGIIVFIDRPADAIVNDVEIKTRPLLAAGTQRVYELYDERIELTENMPLTL